MVWLDGAAPFGAVAIVSVEVAAGVCAGAVLVVAAAPVGGGVCVAVAGVCAVAVFGAVAVGSVDAVWAVVDGVFVGVAAVAPADAAFCLGSRLIGSTLTLYFLAKSRTPSDTWAS